MSFISHLPSNASVKESLKHGVTVVKDNYIPATKDFLGRSVTWIKDILNANPLVTLASATAFATFTSYSIMNRLVGGADYKRLIATLSVTALATAGVSYATLFALGLSITTLPVSLAIGSGVVIGLVLVVVTNKTVSFVENRREAAKVSKTKAEADALIIKNAAQELFIENFAKLSDEGKKEFFNEFSTTALNEMNKLMGEIIARADEAAKVVKEKAEIEKKVAELKNDQTLATTDVSDKEVYVQNLELKLKNATTAQENAEVAAKEANDLLEASVQAKGDAQAALATATTNKSNADKEVVASEGIRALAKNTASADGLTSDAKQQADANLEAALNRVNLSLAAQADANNALQTAQDNLNAAEKRVAENTLAKEQSIAALNAAKLAVTNANAGLASAKTALAEAKTELEEINARIKEEEDKLTPPTV